MRRGFFAIAVCLVVSACSGSMWVALESPYAVYSTDSSPIQIDWQKRNIGTKTILYALYGGRDGRTLWAVGEDGAILRTADGRNWSPRRAGRPTVSMASPADNGALWVVGEKGTILHSPDGQQWRAENSGTSQTLFEVFSTPDGRSQWAVGEEGTILRKSSGSSWTPQASDTTAPLYAVRGTRDGKLLWATGAGGTIVHSSDGATWTAQPSNTVDNLDSLHVADDGTVWAAGFQGGEIVRSRNGTTWEAQKILSTAGITTLVGGTPATRVWAINNAGDILYTVDGEQWMRQRIGILPEFTMERLYSLIATTDGHKLWAIGTSGMVAEGSIAGRVPYLSHARLSVQPRWCVPDRIHRGLPQSLRRSGVSAGAGSERVRIRQAQHCSAAR